MKMLTLRAFAILAVALCLFAPVHSKAILTQSDPEAKTAFLAESAGDAESADDAERANNAESEGVTSLAGHKNKLRRKPSARNLLKRLRKAVFKQAKPRPEVIKKGCYWGTAKQVERHMWWPRAKKISGARFFTALKAKALKKTKTASQAYWKRKKDNFWGEAIKMFRSKIKLMSSAAQKVWWKRKMVQWETINKLKPQIVKSFFTREKARWANDWTSFPQYWHRVTQSYWKKVRYNQKKMSGSKSDKYYRKKHARWTKMVADIPRIKAKWEKRKAIKDKLDASKAVYWRTIGKGLKTKVEGGKRYYMVCRR
eukprot:TRINITY_DN93721_c0_g1_i1.p1 TRINITY_DN93721_c0_g1~~TRINITY_DN93721_c0_g1_i1.p1  ORF type:complete len:312 (+),score=60.50 TRINITY_DN93721_c0_g1_i1:52-987(+)